MRYSYLTPHQYEPLIPYVDTLLVTTYSLTSLDIAVPHGASQWIAVEMANQLKHRFQGRMADLTTGFSLPALGITADTLDATSALYGHTLKCGVVITDRTLVQASARMVDNGQRPWVIVDWWQYFRHRTPAGRLSDLWM